MAAMRVTARHRSTDDDQLRLVYDYIRPLRYLLYADEQ